MVIAAGAEIAACEYSPQSFGSWHVTVLSVPRRRLLWDGKERWYVVEQETSEQWNGMPKWSALWIDRNPNAQAAVVAIQMLCAGSDGAGVRA